MNEAETPSLDNETRLDALADQLAREHGLYERRWTYDDERLETLREIVIDQGLEPEAMTYLTCVLDDLIPRSDECKRN